MICIVEKKNKTVTNRQVKLDAKSSPDLQRTKDDRLGQNLLDRSKIRSAVDRWQELRRTDNISKRRLRSF